MTVSTFEDGRQAGALAAIPKGSAVASDPLRPALWEIIGLLAHLIHDGFDLRLASVA